MSARSGMGRLAQRIAASLSACSNKPSTYTAAQAVSRCAAVHAPLVSVVGRASPSIFSVSPLPSTMRHSVGFAASPIMSSIPCGSVQACGIATDASADSGEDGEGSNAVTGKRSSSVPKAAEGGDDEDPPVIRGPGPASLYGFEDPGLLDVSLLSRDEEDPAAVEAARREARMRDYLRMEHKDPLEWLLFTKDSFLKKDQKTIPIPPHVREVMYRHRWDKALVDVRRSVARQRGLSSKKETYTAMVAVGNFQGLFGLGTASADTAQLAVAQAYLMSFNQLSYIPLYRSHTIYHRIDHAFHEMQMRLMPRKEGWGIRANDLLTSLCTMIGIKNISIASFGRRRNKFYVAQCFLEALRKQSTSYDGAEASGMYLREILPVKTLPFGLRRKADGTWKQEVVPRH